MQIDGVDNNDFWHNIRRQQGGVSGMLASCCRSIRSRFSAQTPSGQNQGVTPRHRQPGREVGGNALHGSLYYFTE